MKHAKSSLTTYLLGSATIMGSALAMAVMLDAPTAAHYIGLTGCTLAVILMASPLATLKTVIDTKNTSAMPFMTSLGGLPCGSVVEVWGGLPCRTHLVFVCWL